jgi:hypothetical protein
LCLTPSKILPFGGDVKPIFLDNILIFLTIRNSILEIYIKIKEERLGYEDLSNEIKKIWLKKKRNIIGFQDKDKSVDNLKEVINAIIDKEIIELTTKSFLFNFYIYFKN